MKILKSVLDIINNSVADFPPETGGILGSSDGLIIDKVVMDEYDLNNQKFCSYFPNVKFLNSNIEIWQKNGIDFKGIFHTHFFGVETLSDGDKQYIDAIMKAMPESVKELYFPIFVLPNRELFCYKAKKNDSGTEISFDETVLVI